MAAATVLGSHLLHHLFPEARPILELHHDELGFLIADVLRQVDVAVAASECAGWDRGRFGCPIRDREVEHLVGQEDHAALEMAMHDRRLARPRRV